MLDRALRSVAMGCVAAAFGLGMLQLEISAQESNLVIEGGTLIDGRGGPAQPETVILIQGNTITAVAGRGTFEYPEGAQVISASGKFILPGLIDMHFHWADWVSELLTAYGITSVVDLNPGPRQLQIKQALAQGRISGLRLFLSSPQMSGRLLWQAGSGRSVRVEDAAMARRLVRELGPGRSIYSLGKAYTELTYDELQAIVEEHHTAGRRVIGHLGSLDARQAAEIGIDALSHSSGIALATISDPVKVRELEAFARLGNGIYHPLFLIYHSYMNPAMADDLIQLLVSKNVRIEANLILIARWASTHLDKFLQQNTELLTNPALSYVDERRRRQYLNLDPERPLLVKDLNSSERDRLHQGYQNLRQFFLKFVRAGGTVLAGSDAIPDSPPGLGLHQELELLVEIGLTPMQAIQAATLNNAEFLQESELGTVEPGKLADLVILEKNPLTDIQNTKSVALVIQNGQLMDTLYHSNFKIDLPQPQQPPRQPAIRTQNGLFVRAIYPMGTKERLQDIEVVLVGSDFVGASVVEFDGIDIQTMPIPTSRLYETAPHPVYTELRAVIPGRLLTRAGTYRALVKNPNGVTSNQVKFFVAPQSGDSEN